MRPQAPKRRFLMRVNKQWFSSIAFLMLTVLMTVTLAAAQSPAPREKILVNFNGNGFAGDAPTGGLIADAAGNFYGVTYAGGIKAGYSYGYGTVYELSPAANGGWKTKSLYKFQPNGTDGQSPVGGLALDSSGNLYGTTAGGGPNWCTDGYDTSTCGTAFELSPDGSGGWSEKIIYNFSQKEGWFPTSLIVDAAGNLYGTTRYTAELNSTTGTVFELQRNGEEWTHTTLHTFGDGEDGALPVGPLLFDKAGNLYGATEIGNASGYGTVFKLTNTGSGWKEGIVFNFPQASGGSEPNGGLIFDSAGNLYGTTYVGGTTGCGVVFKLTPSNGGSWNETVLHTLQCNQNNFLYPEAGLVFDHSGNLYGTTGFGGSSDRGTLFELKPAAGGTWTYFVVHTFLGDPGDGSEPNSSLLLDSKGNLYGTTSGGGTGAGGTVFEITP